MRFIRFLCCLFFPALPLLAQTGYNKVTTWGYPSLYTHNILIDNDTILYYGNVQTGPPNYQWGLLFAKLDTFGNLLSQRIITDSAGYDFSYSKNRDIVKLKDGSGYAFVASFVGKRAGVFILLDQAGKVKLYKEYPDNQVFVEMYTYMTETPDGFLILGYKQKFDYYVGPFVLKIDKQGNKKWEKFYRLPGGLQLAISIRAISVDRYILGSVIDLLDLDDPDYDCYARVWIIDSAGNIVKDHITTTSNEDVGARDPQITPDGGYLYLTGRMRQYGSSIWDWGTNMSIVRRDSAFNEVWRTEVGVLDHIDNVWIDLRPTPDGHWLAMGKQVMPPLPNSEWGWTGGILCKFTQTGEVLWVRTDSTLIEHYGENFNEYSGMGFLSSGNIIVAGQTWQKEPDHHFRAWLVKLTPDGCMDSLFCQTIPVWEPELKASAVVEVFPNPSSGVFSFRWPSTSAAAVLDVFDAQGRMVHHAALSLYEGHTYQWHSPGPGVYWYRLAYTKGILSSGVLVVH